MTAVLRYERVHISYRHRGRGIPAVRDASLSLAPGEALGLVGESGCGKTTLALSALGYLPANARLDGGRILIAGEDLATLNPEALRRLRGRRVAAVYQHPESALNPSLTVGEQIAECYRLHLGQGRAQARVSAVGMLDQVQIPDPAGLLNRYPYQLSGGMQQRVVIAMALVADPALLILDEPTTSLDTTVQAEILELFARLRRSFRSAMLFITHDLGVVRQLCDRIAVMYAGEIVESGPAAQVLAQPAHPYSAALADCIPDLTTDKRNARLATIPGSPPPPGAAQHGCHFASRCPVAEARCEAAPVPLTRLDAGRYSRCLFPQRTAAPGGNRRPPGPLPTVMDHCALTVKDLCVDYGGTRILRDVSLFVRGAETLALVGESGSGKTTLARAITGLAAPAAGSIHLARHRLPNRLARRDRNTLRALQLVFQSPDATLNPSHRIDALLARAVRVLAGTGRSAARTRTQELLRDVMLDPEVARRRPGQISGGQRQRIAIARAFAGRPEVVVLDEPTSALDVSVQAAITNLLLDLQAQSGSAYLFISHDLAVVRYLADRVAVLYLGEIVEEGPVTRVFGGPNHPYTRALVAALPTATGAGAGAGTATLHGSNPGPAARPPGCAFHTRCRLAMEHCRTLRPPVREPSAGHHIHCHLEIPSLPRADG